MSVEGLAVGDWAIVMTPRIFWSSNTPIYRRERVVRVTRTQLVLAGGSRWQRVTGYEVGSATATPKVRRRVFPDAGEAAAAWTRQGATEELGRALRRLCVRFSTGALDSISTLEARAATQAIDRLLVEHERIFGLDDNELGTDEP